MRDVSSPMSLPRRGVFVPVQVDPRGVHGPTAWAARGPRWRRSTRGRYVPAGVEVTADQRIVEAAATLPAYGAVTGWASLHWQGAPWFGGSGHGGLTRPVCLATAGDEVRAQPGVMISAERLDPVDILEVDAVRVTSAVRSVCFEMRYSETLWRAVQCLDMAAYSDHVSVAELAEYAGRHSGWTGIPRCRQALGLSDENSWSPQETTTRLVWLLVAGLPPLQCNRPVFDRAGRHLGTPDLIDLEAGLVVEYDGATHVRSASRGRDIGKEEVYRRAGLEHLTVVADHLREPETLADRMRAVRQRAAFAAESTRAWTTTPPRWWVPTTSVRSRRALDPDQRARLLRYRAS